ncbi:MAG: phospholipase D-like domain-containing protein [Chloroflexota bacterium]|nr:phospholipase D-like domain-containing protein [Chloroflexota bacterium]
MTQRSRTTPPAEPKKTPRWRSILQGIGSFLAAVALGIVALLASLVGVDVNAPAPTIVAPTEIFQPLPTQPPVLSERGVTQFTLPQGFGARKGFWEVLFTAPTGSSRRSLYQGGLEIQLAAAIDAAQRSIDLAAYEFNLPLLTDALIRAHQRGVVVRVVTDDEAGFDDRETTLRQLVEARIRVVIDARRALMHNKFVIIDSTSVWVGSWNFTVNDTYRNNNNMLIIRSRAAVENFQAEFNEMFDQRLFGPNSPSQTPRPDFRQDGIPIRTFFAPEDDVLTALLAEVGGAQQSIQFLVFSFTVDSIAQQMIARAGSGVRVQGIFEVTGSETQFSELRPLFCAGLDARQDGNPYRLHHKVFIIDGRTVITGSFNISQNAVESNDESLVIITDPDLAAEYVREFDRRWAESRLPQGIECN